MHPRLYPRRAMEENVIEGGCGSAVNEGLAARGVLVPVLNFGLPDVIPSASSVRRVVLLPGTDLATPADYSVVTTPGREGVNFTNPAYRPNGVRSYDIYYDED